jgi:mRNA-degrading endonuclease RelE of RelBE toxin-antitoxin system
MSGGTDETAVTDISYTPEFKRNLRALSRKYRSIRADIQPILAELQAGNFVGDQVPGIGYAVYKVRVRNSDLQKGKRAGYRVIYYLQTARSVILITIYAKTEQADISAAQIRRIINEVHSQT